MWLPAYIIEEIEEVAKIYYVNVADTKLWNENRRGGELRLLTGWCWTSLKGGRFQQGFKTRTVAYREAYYALIKHSAAPAIETPKKLRLVSSKRNAA